MQQQQPTQQKAPQQQQQDQGANDQSQQAANYSSEQKLIEEKTTNKTTGETTIKKYSRGKLLGSGGFAKCYEVIAQETKTVLAAKIIPKSTLTKSRQRVKLISEIKIHKSLHHNNIVQFEHVFEDHDNVYILLELCPYQTLNELIKRRKRITEYETKVYVMQIVNALKYLHQNKIIHRDLKLGNLFLGDNMTLKIGDFGLATKIEFDGEKKKTICGTPNYIAPEILEGKEGHSYEVDMWSLGVIIYTLLIGKPPFETKDVRTTYKRIKMNNYCFPEQISISDNAKSIITSILNLNPTKRPTLDELLDHPFMQGADASNLPISTLVVPYQKSKKDAQKEKSSTQIVQLDQKMSQLSLSSTQNQLNMAATQSGLQLNGTKELNGNMRTQSIKNLGSGSNDQANLLKMQSAQNFKPGYTNDVNVDNFPLNAPPASDIWVQQWVDYSNKYGLGYSLNNGTIGVFFNDFTKIVIDPTGQYIEYYEKQPEDKNQKCITFTADNYPAELKKKVILLEHFRSYLQGEHASGNNGTNRNAENTAATPLTFNDAQSGKQMLFYVKKWIKTKNAILFRLQNKIVQVNFSDKTEIILNSVMKIVTYRNKLGARQNFPLSPNLKMYSPEMEKRLKYTKQILTDILKQSQPNAAAAQNPSNNNINMNNNINQNNININQNNINLGNSQKQPMQPSQITNQNNLNLNNNNNNNLLGSQKASSNQLYV